MIRCPNLGAAQFRTGWLGIHMFEDGDVFLMRRSDAGWFPTHRPADAEIDALLRLRAFPELDYGEPTLIDRLRGRKTRKPLEDLRRQLADLLEARRENARKLELAKVRAINRNEK